MREVVGSTFPDGPGGEAAGERDHSGVGGGQRQDGQGSEGTPAGPEGQPGPERRHSEDQPEEGCSPIAEVQACPAEVVAEEAQRRAGGGGGEDAETGPG